MIAIITQARVNSTRLPNKIFLQANGNTFLDYHIERLKSTGIPIFIATTNNGTEKPIVDYSKQKGLQCYKGDEQNVLKRFYECAKEYGIETIIRTTSDCPLIDYNIVANGIRQYQEQDNKRVYYSNSIDRTYPRGMDYEIFSFELLKEAFESAADEADKEHVTPYIWKNKSGNVKILQDINTEDQKDFRLTLDTVEDELLIRILIEQFDAHNKSCNEIVDIMKKNEYLRDINKMIEQKKV